MKHELEANQATNLNIKLGQGDEPHEELAARGDSGDWLVAVPHGVYSQLQVQIQLPHCRHYHQHDKLLS